MTDLQKSLYEANHTDEANRGRQARRARRQRELYEPLAEAMQQSRTAGIKWNIDEDGGEWHPLDRNQHPGQAAILAVQAVLKDFNLPATYNLRYGGMKRSSGQGNAIDAGLIYVEMAMESVSGHKSIIDIPVVVREAKMLSPAYLLHNGEQRVFTQSAFDDILKRGTFYEKEHDRANMYAPPVEGAAAGRQVPLMRPGLYGQGMNRLIHASHDAGAGSELAHIDDAERENPPIMVGDEVKPTEELVVYGRNGVTWTIPSKEKGLVLFDNGAGRSYKVWWEELGFHAVIPGDMLKKA
jgi:hypothetical protein